MPLSCSGSPIRRLAISASFWATIAMTAILPGVAISQDAAATVETAADPEAIDRGFAVWKSQDCIGCHGWAGDGQRIGENPEGPSLRALEMDAEVLKEVILCGRPGTLMPYHDPRAYADDRCYGMTRTDLEGLNMLEGRAMTSEEADDLVAYMFARMIGRPETPNQEDCRAYYGERPFCDRLPTAAEQGL